MLVVTRLDLGPAAPAPLLTTEDLAYHKDVTTSSHNTTYLSSKAVDGYANTYWVADGPTFPQTLQVDLGSRYALSSVTQRFHDTDNSTFFYRMEGSNDAANWTVLADRTASGMAGQTFTEPVSGSYRFVRMTVTNASNGHWASSDAFEVNGKNLALGKSATASSDNGPSYVAANAVDGNTATDWVARGGSMPQWLTVDLGTARSISAISQRFHDADQSTFKYRIEGSTDNVKWTTLVDRTRAGATGQTFIENVTGTYRYVKLTTICASNAHWASSDEMRIFGSEN